MYTQVMNLIFDFDGTICDSFDLTLQIANQYLAGFKKKTIDAKEFRAEGIEKIIKDYKLNKFQILIYIYRGRQEMSRHIADLKTFDGMPEAIEELSISNHLGIVSSNSKKNIEIFLKENGLNKYFDFIYSSPTIFDKAKKINAAIQKFNLEKSEIYDIGDEVRDIEAAKKIEIKSVAVSWGFADKKLLAKFKPDFLTSSPQELLLLEKQLKH